MHALSNAVADYYGQQPLLARIDAALRAAGKDPERATTDDLAPVDQFHIQGKQSTIQLAQLAGLQPGRHVLDIGGGLGGPARTLAQDFGCEVTVLDLTEQFCRTGEVLTARTGLSEHIRFVVGDALHPPLPPQSFDAVWTQHSSMNVADKAELYRQACRMLKPGGKLAIHDVMAGQNSEMSFPVPWASSKEISHLEAPEQVRSHIEAAGFRQLEWRDQTTEALEWLKGRMAAGVAQVAPIGIQLILGESFRQAFQNFFASLTAGSVCIVQAVFVKE